MMKKKILTLILLVTLVLTTVACGDATDKETGNTEHILEQTEDTETSTDDTEPGSEEADTSIEDANGDTEESNTVVEDTNTDTEQTTEDSDNTTGDNHSTGNTDKKPGSQHKHTYTTKVIKPTCTNRGYTLYTCTCGASYKENETHKIPHSYKEERKEPTCQIDGYITYTCSICGYSFQGETLTKLGHAYTVTLENIECFEGVFRYFCHCGKLYTGEEIRNDHDYGGWNTVQAATSTSKGKIQRVCETCGCVQPKEIPLVEEGHIHSYTETVVDATCTNKGYTSHTCICGDCYTDQETPKLNHSYVSRTVEPTCTQGGYTVYVCACGDCYQTERTSPLEHTYITETKASTCGKPGYTNKKCKTCGIVSDSTIILPTEKHKWTTKNLAEAAKEARAAGWSDFTYYEKYTDHNVEACTECKILDMCTVTMAYSQQEAATLMLKYINEYRSGVVYWCDPNLVLDPTLMELAKIRVLELSKGIGCGEGVYTMADERNCSTGRGLKSDLENWKLYLRADGYKYMGYATYCIATDGKVTNYSVLLLWTPEQREIYFTQ